MRLKTDRPILQCPKCRKYVFTEDFRSSKKCPSCGTSLPELIDPSFRQIRTLDVLLVGIVLIIILGMAYLVVKALGG